MIDYKFSALDNVKLNPLVRKMWLFSSVIFFLLVAMLFLPWQQTVEGKGTLMASDPMQRDYTIAASIDGFIDEVYVKENQFVKKGTKLFTIVDLDKKYKERLESIKNSSLGQYKNSQTQVENFKVKRQNLEEFYKTGLSVYEQRDKQTKNKIESLELKKISLAKNHEIEKLNYARTKLLYEEGIESKRNVEVLENRFIKADAELKKIDIDIEIEKNTLTIRQEEKKKFANETQNKIKLLDNSQLSLEIRLKSLSQDIQKNSSNITKYNSGEVVAQKDGYVVRIYQNDKHKFIKKGLKVMLFSPKVTKKSLMLKVSDFNMPLIKEGLPVRIRFYGWPALQISGWPTIQYGTFGGVIEQVEASSHEKGFYYARVGEDSHEVWPKGNDLRIGTQATVWVRLDTVPIWYQLWRLMNAFPPQMITPIIEKK